MNCVITEEELVSPYLLIFKSLLLIPISHYLIFFFLIILLFFYFFFEIHFPRADPVSLSFNPNSDICHFIVSKCRLIHERYFPIFWPSIPYLQSAFLSIFGKRDLFQGTDCGTIALGQLMHSDVVEGISQVVNDITPRTDKTIIAIVVPGLTSDSTAAYIRHLAFRLAKEGWNVVQNHCKLGEISLTFYCYNTGWTEDLSKVIDHIHSQFPEASVFAVGTSIGANVLSPQSSAFQRSKTLPTSSCRRFTALVSPTFGYDFISDIRRDGAVEDTSEMVNGSTPRTDRTTIDVVIAGPISDSTAAFAFRLAKERCNVSVQNHRGLGGISLTSPKSSVFKRSKTLPTSLDWRFVAPVTSTLRYDFVSDIHRGGGSGNYENDTNNFATILNSEETLSQVLETQSLSQRITQLWTNFPLTHCLKFSFSILFIYVMFLRSKVAKVEAENFILLTRWNTTRVPGSDNNETLQLEITHSRAIVLYSVIITIVLPFAFYIYLDDLSHVKNLLRRTNKKKEEVLLKKRIAYSLDVFFSVYPYAKVLALMFATVILIVCGGLALYAVSDCGVNEALWLSWTFVADSGNHTDRIGVGPRIVSVAISVGGMLIFATMLGLISDAISKMVDSLRKGKSEVLESNHILILGWSDKLSSLLKQLAIANKSTGGGVVVVLAERDKEEMEIDIAKFELDLMGTSVICRSGSPLILADLKKVSVSNARAVIVLGSDESADETDARALRVVLSLTRVKDGFKGHIVVEMCDLDNEPLVKLVGGERIETVVAHDMIGRLMIQCALQPGLAQIWEGLLGFQNAEFYIKKWPQLDGYRFKDVLISFPNAIPCGVKVAANGNILLNPRDNYVLEEGDEILVIAEDDDSYSPDSLPEVQMLHFPKMQDPLKCPEKILFCGWRRHIDDMIKVLEALLAPGSELWMFNEVPCQEREKRLTDEGLDLSKLVNIKLVHRHGNAVIRRHLESLPLETFNSILILAEQSLENSIVHSDSRSLATLLLIRDIQSKRLPFKDAKLSALRISGFPNCSWLRKMQQASNKSIVISEILDSRTKNLVSVSRISDYVLSNELVSTALAMVAVDKQINRVLKELFTEKDNELCIRPAEFYLYDQEEVCFYDIMRRARQRQEIIIGYRLAGIDQAMINPSDKSKLTKWSLDDVFVVIASRAS